MAEAVIELMQYAIEEIKYTRNDYDDSVTPDKFQFGVEIGLSESLDAGKITLEAIVPDDKEERQISVRISGYYKINESFVKGEIDKIKELLSVNGTAILLPYLRSVVSMVSTLDGDSIILPTLNVFELLKESEKNK
ncbi:hypothetical protein [Lactococcus petauri]